MRKIYILHGWAYDTTKWETFINLLKKEGLNPVLLKIPGLTSKINKPWNLDEYTFWLEKILNNEKDIILLGHSNGGRIALSYVIKNPQKVTNLILISSAGIYHKDIIDMVKRVVFKKIAKIGKKVSNNHHLKKYLYLLAGEKDYLNANPIMKKTMQNLISVDLEPKLRNISTKTLIIWGKDDKTLPLKDAHTINKLIVNSKLLIVDNARHSPQFTNPEIVVKGIMKFI